MNHDTSYKLLFSHARMVEELIKGFVHEEWVGQLDFTSLEKVSGSYVSDDLRERDDDVIWRVRWAQGWHYVYLLLEFQSTVDPHMVVRILTYLGLLYQDLIRQNQLTAAGRLPPVLPVVLYNGAMRWSAATDVAELIERIPNGPKRHLPRLSYLLLDEGALDESPQMAVRSRTRRGAFTILRLTNKKRMRGTLAALRETLYRRRHDPAAEVGRWLNRGVRGYFNYHAVPGNLTRLNGFRAEVTRAWRQALLRRSQKRRLPWERFRRLVKQFITNVRRVHPWPTERFAS